MLRRVTSVARSRYEVAHATSASIAVTRWVAVDRNEIVPTPLRAVARDSEQRMAQRVVQPSSFSSSAPRERRSFYTFNFMYGTFFRRSYVIHLSRSVTTPVT